MKRIITLAIVLTILVGLYFLMMQSDKEGSHLLGDRNFTIQDFGNVDKIFIRGRGDHGFFLKRKGERWYKDDTLLISKPVMSNLSSVFTKMTVKYIPKPKASEQIKVNLNQVGIEVKLYDKDNSMLKDFWVGRNTNNEDGTAMLMNGAEQPYIMEMPFTVGTLRSFFQISDAGIRDKTVLQLVPDQIDQVKIKYPKHTESAFVLDRGSQSYSVMHLHPTTSIEGRKINLKAVENFLIEFEKLVCESYETGNPNRQTIESTVPFMTCDIKIDDGTTKSMKFWPLKNFIDQEPDPRNRRSLELVERFFMSTGDGNFYLVQHRLYKNLMVTYSYFYL